jgi:hypothetical protein
MFLSLSIVFLFLWIVKHVSIRHDFDEPVTHTDRSRRSLLVDRFINIAMTRVAWCSDPGEMSGLRSGTPDSYTVAVDICTGARADINSTHILMRERRARRAVTVKLFAGNWILQAVSICGQSDPSGISGTVKDRSGAIVPNARIKVINEQTGGAQSTVTNESGLFRAGSLLPGVCQVEAEAEGLQRPMRAADDASSRAIGR